MRAMNEELSPTQAARRIGTSTRTVQRWIATGRLPARRVGGRWRVASDALDAFVDLNRGEGAGPDRAGRLNLETGAGPDRKEASNRLAGTQPDRAGASNRLAGAGHDRAGGLDPDRRKEPLRTLFVANRGEIARRIARTAERLGIRVIVPPAGDGGGRGDASDADRRDATSGADRGDATSRARGPEVAGRADAPHPGGTASSVALVAPTPPRQLDLLDIEAVVAAARAAGADALHPGYGFLAENADFAEAVIAAGIRWVGPPPAAIRAMGDKAGARRLAARLGVPILPGYDDPDQSDDALAAAARTIGLPLLVKPAGGGGGKGMRIVRDLDGLPEALAAARREARAAFGDDRLILERYLERPRHIEVQVLFDLHGAGVHLGERDCSVQRRHQKVLEETPAPAVDEPLRARLASAALRLATAVGYASAGTVEFLVDEAGAFHFLEMNTRLQVEHPVTELVTGRDLVADQLRIAAGEPLGVDQASVDLARRSGGHAIEARLYAEDPETGFLPATGRVAVLRWPTGEGLRVDAGIAAGDEVGGRFDPLLAKIVAHGRDRAEALERLRDALGRTVVLGLTTNLRFLRWLVVQPEVVTGEARTDTLERIWPPGAAAAWRTIPDPAWRTAARLLLADEGGDPWAGGWRLNSAPVVRLATDDEERRVAVEAGALETLTAVRVGDTVHVDVDGRSVPFRLAPPPDVERAVRSAARQHGGGPSQVIAPMPGTVIAVHMAAGRAVEAGDPIVTLEAMKMEHVVPAPVAGSVVEVRVRPSDQVGRGQLLAVIEP